MLAWTYLSTRRVRFPGIAGLAILLALPRVDVTASVRAQNARPVDAIEGIIAAFRQHPVVIIGEAHWLQQSGDFYQRLVRDARFQQTVQDIVVEFVSRNNQPLLDRYIDGEAVPLEELRHIWRDTTKVASWESPIYAEWLATIREVNRKLPAGRRLRVLAGDTPVNWNEIHTHADWAALGDNNISFAEVITDQVLKNKRRALVVLGSKHVTKSGDRNGASNTTTRIEARYPGSTYAVLLLYAGALAAPLEDRLDLPDPGKPALYDLAGTRLANELDQNGSPLVKKADALLYLGPRKALTLALPPAGSLEPAYLEEIDRRSMIEWGELRARQFLGPAGKR